MTVSKDPSPDPNSNSKSSVLESNNECKHQEPLVDDETQNNKTAIEIDFVAAEHKSNQVQEYLTYEDIAAWPNSISDSMVDYIITNKPENVGNIDNLKSMYTDRDRSYFRGLSQDHFYRIKSNGNKEKRDWLVFSETSKCVYCYPCKLFSTSKSKLITEFQNWKYINATLCEHETSKEHMSSMCNLYKRSTNVNRIDGILLQQKNQEQNYWKEVLKRVISKIKLISRLGLAFRGHDKSQNSGRPGNYLTCLEYLSEYDEIN